jgi:hypothetical protein
MRPLTLAVLVSLASTLGGCHVTERAQQCKQLEGLVKQARPGLAQSPIPDSPAPQQLRKRARLYGQLSANLKNVPIDDREVTKERDKVVVQLTTLENHLNRAADAVEEHATISKEEAEEKKKAEAADKAKPVEAVKTTEDQHGENQLDPAKSPPHRVQGLIRSQSTKPHFRTQALAKVREYGRSRSAAEGAGRGLSSALSRLKEACH